MSATEAVKRIEITMPNVKDKFAEWIKSRGGVAIWRNVNMSNMNAGDQYTPAKTVEGSDYPPPHWSVQFQEVITDLSRFRFATKQVERKRIKIALRMGAQGFTIKLTDGSSRRLRAACSKIKEQFGQEPVYHFEDREAVISTLEFEE